MEVFGWIITVLISLYLSFVVVMGSYVEHGFTGKVGGEMLIPLAAAIAAWYFVFTSCPFELIVK
ncbi:hypothetical protein phiAS5_ORF0276 [Aeromonas phage phiAS5]|uniref:Uncharacterized protein n=1 Tax=Aeromonas phage phiAS5 TaxID=879630 RepID=E1A230_9CAUD|nr:hypothetical protein phiAS5_ORF0276 [Aeromonas phage phiAS5]ADM80119.1 hypothetical protein phiAS5_ORF0276 [Aeromonas phage phiAS5]